MKKLFYVILSLFMVMSLIACEPSSGGNKPKKGDFKPALDTNTSCKITVVGNYDNFEALVEEFNRFNEYYPNVNLEYLKLDDYNNTLKLKLDGDDKPNIFFSFTWMMGNQKYDAVLAHAEDLTDSKLNLDLDCLRPGLIAKTNDNKVLMAPVFSRTYGMLINNDLFTKENISIPKTWNELLEVCNQFKEKEYASPMMGYNLKSSSCWMNTVAYPIFVASLANNPEALRKANELDPEAGEYMRQALNTVRALVDNDCLDRQMCCDEIADNYTKVILRFFEGDVPMMICAGDTVSGTKKRETQSEAFSKNPFNYSFIPIPVTENGGYFIDSPSIEFSVNKDCDNLDMTNEFMRFLLSDSELNAMASIKRLATPTKTISADSIYAPFSQTPAERTFSPEVLGIKDALAVQIRVASFEVGKGELTIDEAIAQYGSFE